MNSPHARTIELATDALKLGFGVGWRFLVQLPLVLSQSTDPMPDIAIIRGSARSATSHPTSADLIIEVADTSLCFDCIDKMSLYAAGGIADYWVLDLKYNQLIIHRDPQPDATQVHGHGYTNVQIISATGTISSLAMPSANLKVQDMLP